MTAGAPATGSGQPVELPAPHTRIGVGGVLLREGRALVNRAVYRTRFTIPSGYVEPGESLESAVAREFLEETDVVVRVGPLLLARHKVIRAEESDLYLAFRVDHVSGEPRALPPEIAEVREVPLAEVENARWISSLSRMAVRLAASNAVEWARASWDGGEVPGLATEAYHGSTRGSTR
ncbi:MAG TPA: NUDIX domain-containing protein [Thermoplasmata archaeon]|nr:NUDIX domain-containing protein [Thermoplasmata archaeon]